MECVKCVCVNMGEGDLGMSILSRKPQNPTATSSDSTPYLLEKTSIAELELPISVRDISVRKSIENYSDKNIYIRVEI